MKPFLWPHLTIPLRTLRISAVLLLGFFALTACRAVSEKEGLVEVSADPHSGVETRPAYLQYLKNQRFLEQEPDYYVWDPIAGHFHKPQAERRMGWAEHADRSFVMRTNDLGLREDEDVPVQKPADEVRVLVTGDSHTDGVVPNSESFVNQLEELLKDEFPATRFNVLNAGVGHYGPYNYSRVLKKFADLLPDLFIVVVYIGNDFLDAGRVLEGTGQFKNDRSRAYYEGFDQYLKYERTLSQDLNQIYYLTQFPHMTEPVLDFSVQEMRELQATSTELGVGLLVAFLPTKLDVEADPQAPELDLGRKYLGLSDEDFALNRELADRFGERLATHGMVPLDLLPHLRTRGPGLYWEADHHLGTRGHRAVAEILAAVWRPQFQALAAPPEP